MSENFICYDCFRLKKCKEPLGSWIFFFVLIMAVIAIRAVNVVLDFNPLLAKIFWYIGICGFLVYFLYKFRHDNIMHREIHSANLTNKLLSRKALTDHDYQILGTILCMVSSRKDKINYLLIFLSSGLALIFAIYVDFFKK